MGAALDAIGMLARLVAFDTTSARSNFDCIEFTRATLDAFGVESRVIPDAGGAKALAAKCLERGLLILTCGVYADTVRMLTPLTASEMVMKEGLDILESAILGN